MTMAINKGDRIKPAVLFRILDDGGHAFAETENLFADKKIVIFTGPAPFSRLDTEQAIGYAKLSDKILATGIDAIYGIYCQDAFVCRQFEEHVNKKGKSNNLEIWGDGDGRFARNHEILHDFTGQGLGIRTGRWAMIVNNRKVEYVIVDDYSMIDLTGADKILEYLNEAKV